ncbi:MAG: hypothetical protein U5M23_01320 [Marinagarivorans sp.]|nr:hypothetical protein [Marinagarivorans sp.]
MIDGERFRFWSRLQITNEIDGISTFQFSAPFEPDNEIFRRVFRPLSFKKVQITVGGSPLFTGTLVDVTPSIDPDANTIEISGYSTIGVLADCTQAESTLNLDFEGMTLADIATALCAPFGIGVVTRADVGPAFADGVAIQPSDNVWQFLTDLAQQRGLILSNDDLGNLTISNGAARGQPVARLEQGQPPLISIAPRFSAQDYYSHLTGLSPMSIEDDGGRVTELNPHLSVPLRPLSFVANDIDGAALGSATRGKMGRMIANAITYSVDVATWRDQAGSLFSPQTLVTLIAPRAMIYSNYTFMIRSVSFNRDGSSASASLELVLAGSFTDRVPARLPWDL